MRDDSHRAERKREHIKTSAKVTGSPPHRLGESRSACGGLLLSAAAGENEPYKYPREVELASGLPKTISGKIRRVQLRGRKRLRKAQQTGR
jgi:hypothetical protein